MGNFAYLFSGQGSQRVAMGEDFVGYCDETSEVYKVGSEILGYDLWEMISTSTEQELAQTAYAQPAIFAVSVAAFRAAAKNGFPVENTAVAGHSLGEYAAMVAAGVLSLEDGFRAIKIRSAAMQKAAEQTQSGMMAVLGGDIAAIEQVCAQITASGDFVTPANYNSGAQTVIAGELPALAKAAVELKNAGVRRTVTLGVSAAFHTKFMQGAADEIEQQLSQLTFSAPKNGMKFYSNVHGKQLTDFGEMPSYLAQHCKSPVLFTSELAAMQADGFDTFVELGIGSTLSGFVKKTLNEVDTMSIDDLKSLEAAKENLL